VCENSRRQSRTLCAFENQLVLKSLTSLRNASDIQLIVLLAFLDSLVRTSKSLDQNGANRKRDEKINLAPLVFWLNNNAMATNILE
jgi:hypothetical protein